MADLKKALIERLFVEQRGALQAFFQYRIKTQHEVVDLVQEVYVRMLRVKDLDAILNPEGYLYTVAHNLVREQAVMKQRQHGNTDHEEPHIQAELASPAGFEDLFDFRARVGRLHEVLQQLSPKCRAVVYMKYQHALSYQEIAEHLQISSHMVQKYLSLALAHCRRRMVRMN